MTTETAGSDYFMINNGSTCRYHKLATVETAQPEDNAIISSASSAPRSCRRCASACWNAKSAGQPGLHPGCSATLLVVVAPLGDVPVLGFVRAFLTNGRQGVNYHRGVWAPSGADDRKAG